MANSPNSPSLSIHKDSQTISKTKPKIRIIHIFAPEIIKTDVGNFRELVQTLTGKPTGGKHCKKKPTTAASTSGLSDEPQISKMELRKGVYGLDDESREREKEKKARFCSNDDENRGGYLGEFSDLEGFISQQLGDFPLLPMDETHIQGFELPQL